MHNIQVFVHNELQDVITAHSIFTPSLEFGLSMAIVCPILNRQGHGVMQRDVMT